MFSETHKVYFLLDYFIVNLLCVKFLKIDPSNLLVWIICWHGNLNAYFLGCFHPEAQREVLEPYFGSLIYDEFNVWIQVMIDLHGLAKYQSFSFELVLQYPFSSCCRICFSSYSF